MQIRNDLIHREITDAVTNGLRIRYGEVLGALYGEIVNYYPGRFLEIEQLRRDLDVEAVPVLHAILHNKIEPPVLHAIRSLMIGCAITGDQAAVLRWATEGLNRSRQFGDEWKKTVPQWEAVLNDPNQFILYARQIKLFLTQI